MLHKAETLKGYTLDCIGGEEIGKVKEFYFDDHHWAVRYLVADTGDWLTSRQILISPYALGALITEKKHIAIELTRKQIEDSPSLTTDKPLSLQFEESYYKFHGWPTYWGGSYMWGAYPRIVRDREQWNKVNPGEKPWEPHLRSTHDVNGHHIQAADGEIGHVEDFIIDDETWAIRYLLINTLNWWPGKKVLLSPQWIETVSWTEAKVIVNLPRETIKQSPEYTDESLLTRDYETLLYQHYNRLGYWVEEPADMVHAH